MSKVVLIGNVCCYNESAKDNLRRCLNNLKEYCDQIVLYDDDSEDNSVEIAQHYTSHIIRGDKNDQMNELRHKQMMLDKSLQLGATHIWWMDCDEVLDRYGAEGGLRAICENWPSGVDAFSFPEVNLWRGESWARVDTLFAKARFVRLWKIQPGIRFDVQEGVHLRLYPSTINKVQEATLKVLHYGFCDYLRMTEKIGAHRMKEEELHQCAETNWILDERNCRCYRVPVQWYPNGCMPLKQTEEPKPRPINELITTKQLWKSNPLMDVTSERIWSSAHANNYHGQEQDFMLRLSRAWKEGVPHPIQRSSRFSFDPVGKNIVDIGSGGGWFSLDCIRAGAKKVWCIEADGGLIAQAKSAFKHLVVPEERYEFLHVLESTPWDLSPVDIIFCIAVFQHIPFQTARTWMRWTSDKLKPDGFAYFQFHRTEEMTTFMNSEQKISTVWLERDMADAGLEIVSCTLAEGKGLLPVWWLYTLRKAG